MAGLCEYADGVSTTKPRGIVPIVRSRARSFTLNPNAKADDVALIVGKNRQSECVCYMGLMPGSLKFRDSVIKIYWASTGYVSRQYRGVGTDQMLDFARQNTEIIIATGNSAQADRVYRRLGFVERNRTHTIKIKFGIIEKALRKIQSIFLEIEYLNAKIMII